MDYQKTSKESFWAKYPEEKQLLEREITYLKSEELRNQNANSESRQYIKKRKDVLEQILNKERTENETLSETEMGAIHEWEKASEELNLVFGYEEHLKKNPILTRKQDIDQKIWDQQQKVNKARSLPAVIGLSFAALICLAIPIIGFIQEADVIFVGIFLLAVGVLLIAVVVTIIKKSKPKVKTEKATLEIYKKDLSNYNNAPLYFNGVDPHIEVLSKPFMEEQERRGVIAQKKKAKKHGIAAVVIIAVVLILAAAGAILINIKNKDNALQQIYMNLQGQEYEDTYYSETKLYDDNNTLQYSFYGIKSTFTFSSDGTLTWERQYDRNDHMKWSDPITTKEQYNVVYRGGLFFNGNKLFIELEHGDVLNVSFDSKGILIKKYLPKDVYISSQGAEHLYAPKELKSIDTSYVPFNSSSSSSNNSSSSHAGKTKCSTCDGTGKVKKTFGVTWIKNHPEYEYGHRCPDCNGTGWR